MTAALRMLRKDARRVAADGTDPDHLAAVVAWSAQPRHHPDALRRRCRDRELPTAGASDDRSAGVTTEPGDQQARPPSAELAALAGAPSAATAEAARPLFTAWHDLGVRVALIGDPTYPDGLAEGWPQLDPPVWLAWRGQPPGHASGVALVGARRASSYGTGIAAWLAEAVADAGIRVVSGGAVGIDAAAHEAAIERPGRTTVVLGCGHAILYPRPHARVGGLFGRILDHGGSLVSEALPHEPPRAHQIRSRNRIVAGLSAAVVVVEGGERSGALLTAGAAAERGRAVLAVPGDVRAAGSAAPHRLLAEGAEPCCSPSQLLDAVGGRAQGNDVQGGGAATGQPSGAVSTLPAPVHAVLAASWPRAVRLEDLARQAGLPVGGLLASVTRARVHGEVAEAADGVRLRRAPGHGPSGGRG